MIVVCPGCRRMPTVTYHGDNPRWPGVTVYGCSHHKDELKGELFMWRETPDGWMDANDNVIDPGFLIEGGPELVTAAPVIATSGDELAAEFEHAIQAYCENRDWAKIRPAEIAEIVVGILRDRQIAA